MTTKSDIQIITPDQMSFTKENWIVKTPIEGLLLFSPQFYPDQERGGGFQELYRVAAINQALGETIKPVAQSPISWSSQGVLRGMHAGPEDKYAVPMIGDFQIAVVDVRKGSPTLGRVVTFEIDSTSPGKKPQIGYFVRRGLAHGFYVKNAGPLGVALFVYSVTAEYNKDTSRGFNPYDPKVAIPWNDKNAALSTNDKSQPSFEEFVRTVDQGMYK